MFPHRLSFEIVSELCLYECVICAGRPRPQVRELYQVVSIRLTDDRTDKEPVDIATVAYYIERDVRHFVRAVSAFRPFKKALFACKVIEYIFDSRQGLHILRNNHFFV